MQIKLNVYDIDMKTVKKEVCANTVVLPFGLIRKMMALFNVENLNDTSQIISIVMKSWTQVVSLLDIIFPGIEPDEWDYVSTTELGKAVIAILKSSFSEMMNIPTEKN